MSRQEYPAGTSGADLFVYDLLQLPEGKRAKQISESRLKALVKFKTQLAELKEIAKKAGVEKISLKTIGTILRDGAATVPVNSLWVRDKQNYKVQALAWDKETHQITVIYYRIDEEGVLFSHAIGDFIGEFEAWS